MDYTSLQTYLANPNFQSNTSLGGILGYGNNSSGGFGSNFFGNSPNLGFNSNTLQLGLSGLGALGNFWNAFQAQKLAKDQFNFTKDITNTNLANQMKSYNTTLADRAKSRGVVEGQTDQQVQDYINKNSL